MVRRPAHLKTREETAERGAILILSALIMMLLLFIAAFATDLGAWYRQGQAQQRAADVSSLNGIQAYDREAKAYLDSLSATDWSGLSNDARTTGERQAMLAAINTITGLLETSGYSFSASPVEVQLSPQPNSPGDESIYTITADDGTLVTVTRTSSGISVSLVADGDQYFSNLLRSAPQITRDATAVISNCGADCSRDIELAPPFNGFAAGGKGDGYRPLLGENDTIWAVNHHAGYGGYMSSRYSIVCMDANTEATCSNWAPLDQKYVTHPKADDVIDNDRNRIYFPANNYTSAGVACVTTDTRGWCPGSDEFTSLTNHPHVYSDTFRSPMLSFHGIWRVGTYPNDKLFMVGQDGRMHCLLPDQLGTANPNCSGYPNNTTIVGGSNVPTTASGQYSVMGELIGTKIISHHFMTNSTSRWQCWDTATNASCWSGSVASAYTSWNYWSAMKFIKYDSSGNQIGLCIAQSRVNYTSSGTMPHECISLGGSIVSDVPGLVLDPLGDDLYTFGEGYTWLGENGEARMFIGSLYSNTINCYDWVTASSCGAFTGVDIYGMITLNDECVIGVGDSANFYTFDPMTQEPCTASKVTTDIYPCKCVDDSFRYGVLELPEALKNVLESAEAVVTGGAITQTGDLLTSPMDLSDFNGVNGPLELVITVDSKLDGNGDLLWTETYAANLSLVVQPTLTG